MSRILVMGDCHGRIEALKQCLKKSKFDYEKDKLIFLGDVADGGYNTYECVEELLKIKNLVFILGNHDEFFVNHIKSGWAEEIWLQQGGCNTLNSYGADAKEAKDVTERSVVDTTNLNIPMTHQDFFNNAVFYHIEGKKLFVHGGFRPKIGVENETRDILLWDRDLIDYARVRPIPKWEEVFIGHTNTQIFGNDPKIKNCLEPLKFNNLWMMDTGAGWTGRLSIMCIKTKKFWQSNIQGSPLEGDKNWN